MKKVFNSPGQSFIDAVISNALSMEAVITSAIASGQSLDAVPEPGTELLIEVPTLPLQKPLTPQLPVFVPKMKIVQEDNQNIPDLVLEAKGSIEALFAFCLENGIGISEPTQTGRVYIVPEGEFDTGVVNLFKNKKTRVATGANTILVPIPESILFEFGLFEPGIFE